MYKFKYLICWKTGNDYMSVENDDLNVSKYLAKILSQNMDISEVEIIDQIKGGNIEFE